MHIPGQSYLHLQVSRSDAIWLYWQHRMSPTQLHAILHPLYRTHRITIYASTLQTLIAETENTLGIMHTIIYIDIRTEMVKRQQHPILSGVISIHVGYSWEKSVMHKIMLGFVLQNNLWMVLIIRFICTTPWYIFPSLWLYPVASWIQFSKSKLCSVGSIGEF